MFSCCEDDIVGSVQNAGDCLRDFCKVLYTVAAGGETQFSMFAQGSVYFRSFVPFLCNFTFVIYLSVLRVWYLLEPCDTSKCHIHDNAVCFRWCALAKLGLYFDGFFVVGRLCKMVEHFLFIFLNSLPLNPNKFQFVLCFYNLEFFLFFFNLPFSSSQP